jgi:hypothetical protein
VSRSADLVSNIDAVFTTGGEPTAPATDDEHARTQ